MKTNWKKRKKKQKTNRRILQFRRNRPNTETKKVHDSYGK